MLTLVLKAAPEKRRHYLTVHRLSSTPHCEDVQNKVAPSVTLL